MDEKQGLWSRKERDTDLDEVSDLFDTIVAQRKARIKAEVAFIDRVLAGRSPRESQRQEMLATRRALLSRLSANRLTGLQE